MADRVVLFETAQGALQGASRGERLVAGGFASGPVGFPSTITINTASGNIDIVATAAGSNLSLIAVNQIILSGTTVVINPPVAPKLQTSASALLAALGIGAFAGDPSALVDGDLWYNSLANRFRKREGGITSNLVTSGAATLVVHPTPGVGDYTDIQTALNNLPAAGGLILVREGTYNIITTIQMPAKDVSIVGCGRNTIVDIGSSVIAAFTMSNPGGGNTYFANFAVQASTPTAGQRGFEFVGLTQFVDNFFVNIFVGGIEKVFRNAGTGEFNPTCTDCTFTVPGTVTSRLFDSGASVGGTITLLRCTQNNQSGITGSNANLVAMGSTLDGTWGITVLHCDLVDCDINLTSSFLTLSQRGSIVGCAIDIGGPAGIVLTGAAGSSVVMGCRIVATGGVVNAINVQVDNVTIDGNEFQSVATYNIRTNSKFGVYTGNRNLSVNEVAGADSNVYSGNQGVTIANSVFTDTATVDGTQKRSITGSTTGSFVLILPIRQSINGLFGMGTIKNTGANSMEVRETVTDAFGNAGTATTTVLAGADYQLDAQTDFGVARPPYVLYQVEVRHPTAVTTFNLKHVTHGAIL